MRGGSEAGPILTLSLSLPQVHAASEELWPDRILSGQEGKTHCLALTCLRLSLFHHVAPLGAGVAGGCWAPVGGGGSEPQAWSRRLPAPCRDKGLTQLRRDGELSAARCVNASSLARRRCSPPHDLPGGAAFQHLLEAFCTSQAVAQRAWAPGCPAQSRGVPSLLREGILRVGQVPVHPAVRVGVT